VVSGRALRLTSRGAAALAALAGAVGALTLLGAFGPVDCWIARSASSAGPTVVTHGCEAGIDYLFGRTTGNAPLLFFWALVLAVLVGVGASAAWTGHRRLTWAAVVIGGGLSVLGLLSVGWAFALPTLCLLVAAGAMAIEDRQPDPSQSAP